MKTVCVYCGSSEGTRSTHREAASELGESLAESGIALVFGGGRVGLMGCIADAMLARGGHVTGVIPEFLVEREVGHADCTVLHTTTTMHERKARMAELADAFIILPGGLGTLEELFEVITWRQLGLHDKPILVANIDGYWDTLFSLLNGMNSENYVPNGFLHLVEFVPSIAELAPRLDALPTSGSGLDSERI